MTTGERPRERGYTGGEPNARRPRRRRRCPRALLPSAGGGHVAVAARRTILYRRRPRRRRRSYRAVFLLFLYPLVFFSHRPSTPTHPPADIRRGRPSDRLFSPPTATRPPAAAGFTRYLSVYSGVVVLRHSLLSFFSDIISYYT